VVEKTGGKSLRFSFGPEIGCLNAFVVSGTARQRRLRHGSGGPARLPTNQPRAAQSAARAGLPMVVGLPMSRKGSETWGTPGFSEFAGIWATRLLPAYRNPTLQRTKGGIPPNKLVNVPSVAGLIVPGLILN
jgi:hypothetical protein